MVEKNLFGQFLEKIQLFLQFETSVMKSPNAELQIIIFRWRMRTITEFSSFFFQDLDNLSPSVGITSTGWWSENRLLLMNQQKIFAQNLEKYRL